MYACVDGRCKLKLILEWKIAEVVVCWKEEKVGSGRE
jgi:hypothetical protein